MVNSHTKYRNVFNQNHSYCMEFNNEAPWPLRFVITPIFCLIYTVFSFFVTNKTIPIFLRFPFMDCSGGENADWHLWKLPTWWKYSLFEVWHRLWKEMRRNLVQGGSGWAAFFLWLTPVQRLLLSVIMHTPTNLQHYHNLNKLLLLRAPLSTHVSLKSWKQCYWRTIKQPCRILIN